MHTQAKNAASICNRNFKLREILGTVALSAAIVLTGSGVAMAQEVADDRPTVSDEVEDTFFTFDQPYFYNRRFVRNALWIFGSFPENEISGDGRVMHNLYTDLMKQQSMSDPTIRTADLPNPFTSSLLADPIYTEEPVPAAPFAPSFRQSPNAAPTSSGADRTETRETPVPALW